VLLSYASKTSCQENVPIKALLPKFSSCLIFCLLSAFSSLLLGQQQLLLLPGATDSASAFDARTNNFSEIGPVEEIPLEIQSGWLHFDMKDSEADILYFPPNSFSLYRVFSDTRDSLLFEQTDPKVKLAN
jgi:hypothetical protein